MSTEQTPNIPTSIDAYLEAVRAALAGADKALVQDALYDAEDHMRSEMAENPTLSEAEVIARIWNSYGAPEEVASIYRDTEIKVTRALKPPRPPKQDNAFARFFGVIFDWRAWTSIFYMLLSMVTGLFYFTWATTGLGLSIGLAILIIGIPFFILFLGSVRVLSLVEGRMVEAMLGVRMPRRPIYGDQHLPLMTRIKDMFVDPRTWATLLYMIMMCPLGILYFTIAFSLLSLFLSLVAGPVVWWILPGSSMYLSISPFGNDPGPLSVLAFLIGVVGLFATLHLAKGIGYLHGHIAKHLLVKEARD